MNFKKNCLNGLYSEIFCISKELTITSTCFEFSWSRVRKQILYSALPGTASAEYPILVYNVDSPCLDSFALSRCASFPRLPGEHLRVPPRMRSEGAEFETLHKPLIDAGWVHGQAANCAGILAANPCSSHSRGLINMWEVYNWLSHV